MDMQFPRVQGKPLKIELGDHRMAKVGSERVIINLMITIESKQVIVQRQYAIFDDIADDIVFSAKTMRELGLFAVQQRAGVEIADKPQEDIEENHLVEWEHCLGEEIESKTMKKIIKMKQDEVQMNVNTPNTQSSEQVLEILVDVNKSFPLYNELSNLVIEYQDLFQAFDGIGIKHVPDMQIVLKAGGTFRRLPSRYLSPCLLYTSDAADE